jgi:hypothetical protein
MAAAPEKAPESLTESQMRQLDNQVTYYDALSIQIHSTGGIIPCFEPNSVKRHFCLNAAKGTFLQTASPRPSGWRHSDVPVGAGPGPHRLLD